MPEVSVIIPTYNHGHYLAEAIRSVLRQTFHDVEILVVDDGSTDHTKQVVSSFGNVLHYLHQDNRGYAAARNTAIRHASGALIAFLDADDVWLPPKLELQVQYLAQHPHVGVASANCYYMDASGRLIGTTPSHPQAAGWIFERLVLTGNCIAMPTVMVRRQCFADVGLFDESLSTTADWDLWLRLSRRYPFGYIDQWVAKYRVHGANMHRNAVLKEKDTLAILAKVFSEPGLSPAIIGKRHQAYSFAHVDIARRYLLSGQPDIARQHLWQALLRYPRRMLSPLFVRLMIGSFLGSWLYMTMRSWRDAVRSRSLSKMNSIEVP